MDRTATKVQKSKYSASKVETRKKTWDEINSAAGKVGKKGTNMFAGLDDQEDEDDEEEDKKNGWEDVKELDDEMAESEPVVAANKTGVLSSSVHAPAAPPPADEDEDIL